MKQYHIEKLFVRASEFLAS